MNHEVFNTEVEETAEKLREKLLEIWWAKCLFFTEKDAGFVDKCDLTPNKIVIFPFHSWTKETGARIPGILLEM